MPLPELLESQRGAALATWESLRPSPHDQALWDAACEDKAEGRALGAFLNLDQVQAALVNAGLCPELARSFILAKRFGVEQETKVRACDDYHRS
jgi:hypothetical protein